MSDPELQSASSSSRGIWINALCYMWEAKERGILQGTVESLCRILNCTVEEFNRFLEESKIYGFDDLVTHNNGKVTLVNRRMQRDERERNLHKKRQDRYRDRHKQPPNDVESDAEVTPSSPSPSPKENIIKESFGEFQNVKLSEEEHNSLVKKFGKDGTNTRIENLSSYIASKGKKYKSHYATILTWERNHPANAKTW